MASGNYRDQPVESPPQTPTRSDIRPRARATQKIGKDTLPSARETKVIEPETQTERAARPQRAAPARKAVAVQDPDITEPSLRYQYAPETPHPLTRHRSWLSRLVLTVVCVVIGALVLTIAGMYMRQPNGPVQMYTQGQSFPIQLGGSYQAFQTWNNSTGPIPSQTPLPKNPGPYTVLGKPTISAQLINTVLASYHSPTAGMGQTLYDLGVQYGIDPVYPLAFFMHESLFGTTGEARVTLSLGNERCIPDRACIDQNRGGYAKMNSWQDGFEHWYKLIRNLYVAQWGRVTVDQIIPKYAPNSDGNNEKQYIATLKHEVDVWRAGGIRP